MNFGPALTTPPYQVFWDTTQATNGSHTIRVKALDIGGNQAISPIVTVTVANSATTPLTASLLVGTSAGDAPLTTSLTAVAQGTATGTYNYTFYCNNTDASTNITTPYDAKVNGTSTDPFIQANLCAYPNAGTYTPKIIIEQGTSAAEAQGTVTVTQASSGGSGGGGGGSSGGGGGSSGGGGGGGGGGGSYYGGTSFTVGISVVTTTVTTAKIAVVNSLPATTQLFYGTSTAYSSSTNVSLSLTTSYFNLAGLVPNTTYHLRATSLANGQTATSPDITFIPGIIPLVPVAPTSPSSPVSTPSLPPLTRNLSLGTTGSDVTELQTFLQGQGYLTAAPTGYFGNLTKAAVEKFQQANQIAPVSGLVGPLTRAKVNALLGTTTTPAPPATTTSTSSTSISTGTLSLGAEGPAVTQLQAFLQTQGYLPVAPTGYFGILTQHAVQAFQCGENIVCTGTPATTGYGVVGPKTRGRMGE